MSVSIAAHHFYISKGTQIPFFLRKKKLCALFYVPHLLLKSITHHIRGWGICWFSYFDRLEYEQLKAKCREMDTAVGSGRVITMPVVTEDGQPIENLNGGASGSEQKNSGAPLPKEVIDWKLTLHQIGKHCCSFFSISYILGFPEPCIRREARDRAIPS